MSALLEVRDLKQHFPVEEGLVDEICRLAGELDGVGDHHPVPDLAVVGHVRVRHHQDMAADARGLAGLGGEELARVFLAKDYRNDPGGMDTTKEIWATPLKRAAS